MLALSVSGQFPTTTPFDAVGLNVSSIEGVGTGDGGYGTNDAQLQESLVACFASFYAATHSFIDSTTSTPNTCSMTTLFQSLEVEACFADLCVPTTLNPDLGGIGVCSGQSSSAAFRH